MAGALLLLVGGSIALAGGAISPDGGRSRGPLASAPPPPAPTLLGPRSTLVSSPTIDVTLVRPPNLRADQEYQVVITVNGERVRQRQLPAADQFTLEGVPLDQGANTIRAMLVGAGGQGSPSAALAVTRDDVAPVIRVNRPEPGATVYSDAEVLRGRTEPGADVTVVDAASGVELDTSVEADGRFETRLALELGDNTLQLHSRDPAGNEARARVVITRVASKASVRLIVAPSVIAPAELPTAIEMVATVVDELGRRVDEAEVTFSVSPPNRSTMTYRTTTTGGQASWTDLEIAAGADSSGTWLVTVLAVLPFGAELRADESFAVE